MGVQFSCLVVDDSAGIRQMLVAALSRMPNMKVTDADDGIVAIRKLSTAHFDIILTDINMPIVDGLKLIKRIRDDEKHKSVPIIVISTESAAEDRRRALSLGANAYLVKPVKATQVIDKVRELLKISA